MRDLCAHNYGIIRTIESKIIAGTNSAEKGFNNKLTTEGSYFQTVCQGSTKLFLKYVSPLLLLFLHNIYDRTNRTNTFLIDRKCFQLIGNLSLMEMFKTG